MKKYNKQDIIHVLKGSAFLGAGGGGSYEYGMKLLTQLENMGYTPEFDLYDVDEMEAGAYACMVAALGKPTAIDPTELSSDLPAAYKTLQIAAKTDGHELGYLYSAEMGGFNTMVPIFLSIIAANHGEKIGVVDVDANGRAVPALNTCLTNARGFAPAPLAMAGHKQGEPQYRYISWPENAASAEAMARKLDGDWYSLVGFSTWLMSASEMKANAGINYISYAKRIGAALDNTDMPLYDALHSVMPQIKELYSGKIEDIITDGAGGFDKGKIIISNPNRSDYKLCIVFQNESLVVGKYEKGVLTDEIYMTAPDLISMVDTDTRKPLTNDSVVDIKVGQSVTVFLSPAHYYWWDNKKAYTCFKPIFEANGYHGDFVQYVPFFEKNREPMSETRSMNLQTAFSGGTISHSGSLLQHLQNNLYNNTSGVPVDKMTGIVYTDSDEPLASEPTITEQDMVRNGPQILQLAKDRYVDTGKTEYWAGSFIPHFADEKTTRATREATARPVFDAFDPATLLSLAIGENVGIITWPKSIVPTLERRIAGAGLDGRIKMIKSVDSTDVPTIRTLTPIVDQMINSGIQCIIIGRSFIPEGSSADYDLATALQDACQNRIPILDANKIAARWLELNIHMGYFHSRLSYYTPPAKNV